MKLQITLTDDEIEAMQFLVRDGYRIILIVSHNRFVEICAKAGECYERIQSPLYQWIRRELTQREQP